jgi:hypothetical protein
MRLLLKEYRTTVDHSQNGVKVISHKFFDNKGELLGSTVESDCQCFGMTFRTHTNPNCPLLKTQRESRSV